MDDQAAVEPRKADDEGEAAAGRRLGIELQERGDIDGAEAACARAADRGDVTALAKLAILIDIHRDDPERAEAAYRRADEAGSVDGAGNVGRILRERGDLRGAEAAFQRCVERGSVRALADYAGLLSQREDADPDEVAEVVAKLCEVEDLSNQGGSEAAQNDLIVEAMAPMAVFSGMWECCDPAAMEAGVRAADSGGSAAGAYHLGLVLRARGELGESVEASTRAGERGCALGWVNAGATLGELGDWAGAEAAAERAEQEGEAAGATLLGTIFDQRGEPDQALEAYRRGDAGGDANGSFNLGVELLERDRLEEAEAALERAETRGGERAAAARAVARRKVGLPPAGQTSREPGEPAWDYAVRLERLGDVAGAGLAFSAALETGEEPTSPMAMLRYAEALELRNDPAAEAAFQRLAEAPEPAVRAAAWRGISRYRLDRGETLAGFEAMQEIIGTGDPEEVPRAWANLGAAREDIGELDAARAAYESAIAFDHPKHSSRAKVNLAQVMDKQGDQAGASAAFREVAESDHPEQAPRAMFLLGVLLLEQGQEVLALERLEQAMESENEEWSQRAHFQAGGIYLMSLADFDRAAGAFGVAEGIDELGQSLIASYLRGEAERQRGNEQEALAAYNRVLAAEGADAGPVRFSAAKQAGVILLGREEYPAAREMLRLAAGATDPEESARGLCLLGACERQLGNREGAIAALEQAHAMPGAPQDIRELARQGLQEIR